MRTSALFGAKNSNFLKFMVCLYGQEGGVCPAVRTFCGQGERGSIFAILRGRLLWKVPKTY